MSSELLQKNISALEKQYNWLKRSFDICKNINPDSILSTDEFDYLETLAGRFGRSIDFLIRKVFRTIDDIEFEAQGTLIDVVNNAHKRNLFSNIEEIRK